MVIKFNMLNLTFLAFALELLENLEEIVPRYWQNVDHEQVTVWYLLSKSSVSKGLKMLNI